jgi:hypothetical protein
MSLSEKEYGVMQTQVGSILTRPILPKLRVSVQESRYEPGVWTVEAIDDHGDGDIFQSFFAGPEAEKRAHEYARFKYPS